jgi:hypothetical protein
MPPDAMWVDGQWVWEGRRWIWERGRYIVKDPQACFVASRLIFHESGTILYGPGFWMTDDGRRLEPKTLKPAGYPPRRRTPEEP